MNIANKSIKIYYRTPQIIIAALLSLVLIASHFMIEINNLAIHHDVMWFLNVSLRISLLIFLFSAYTSYEYMTKIKSNHLHECIEAHNAGLLKTYGSKLLVLAAVSFFYFFLFTALSFAVSLLAGVQKMEYLFHIVRVNMIYIFFVSLMASFLGSCLALTMKRLGALMIIFIVFLILSPIFETIPAAIYAANNLDIYPISNFFRLVLPDSLDTQPDFLYGIPMESFRWNLSIFWSSLLLGIFMVNIIKRKKAKILAGVFAMICMGSSLFGYIAGGSLINTQIGPHNVHTKDALYYTNVEQKEQPAGFDISGYKMNLSIDRQLTADVKISVDNQHLNKYIFTLYRGYKVKNVFDAAGNTLDFEQDGDYVDVLVQPRMESNEIRMIYEGYSPIFYSNKQAILLPGFFPYYPLSGHRRVCYTDPERGVWNFDLSSDGKDKDFEVVINSEAKVISNLEMRDNTHTGRSDALTLVGGFIAKENLGGYETYILPIDNLSKERKVATLRTLQNEIDKYEQLLGVPEHTELSCYRIFQSPETLINRAGHGTGRGSILALALKDHMFLALGFEPDWVALALLLYDTNGMYTKHPAVDTLVQYLHRKDDFQADMTPQKEKFVKGIEMLGEDYVLKSTYSFIKDKSDPQTFEDFLDKLGG